MTSILRTRRHAHVSQQPPPELINLVELNGTVDLVTNLGDSFFRFKSTNNYTTGKKLSDYTDFPGTEEYANFMKYLETEYSTENLIYYTKFKSLNLDEYGLFVRGLHDIVSDEEAFSSLNISSGHSKKLRKAAAMYWDDSSHAARSLLEVAKLKPAPKEVQTFITTTRKTLREYMNESFHRFQVNNAPETINAVDAFDPVTVSEGSETPARAAQRIKKASGGYAMHLQQEGCLHHLKCYRALRKMEFLMTYNYDSTMYILSVVYAQNFGKTRKEHAPTKSNPTATTQVLNKNWINFPKTIVAKMEKIYKKYYAVDMAISLEQLKKKKKEAGVPKNNNSNSNNNNNATPSKTKKSKTVSKK